MVYQFKRLYQPSASPVSSLYKSFLRGTRPRRGLFAGDPYFGLKGQIVGYWRLDEVTGAVRVDSSPNGNNLTNNNNCTQVAGKIGFGTGFVAASSQYLSIANNATLQVGGTNLTVAGWFQTTTAIEQALVSKGDPSGAPRSYLVEVQASKLRWIISNAAGSFSAIVSTKTVNDGAWHFFVCDYDDASKVIRIIIDGDIAGAITGSSISLGSETGPFNLGRLNTSFYFDGSLDAIGVWKRKLTDDSIAVLYNGGAGVEIYY